MQWSRVYRLVAIGLNDVELMKPITRGTGFHHRHYFSLARPLVLAGLVICARTGLAQTQSAPPDSIVQLTAEAQGLELLPPEEVPPFGTFWLVTPGGFGCLLAPLPTRPDATLPTYPIVDGIYLVDGTGGQALPDTLPAERRTTDLINAALEAQATAVVNLISQIQGAQMSRALSSRFSLDAESGGSGAGDDYLSEARLVIDTNRLWLEITNVSSGIVHANLRHATNQVYAIWSTTNLVTAWAVETEVWPQDTNCWPFTVPTLDRPDLFLRAQDWTGLDSDGDGLPDWWEWKYFGSQTHSGTDLGLNGLALSESYWRGLNPNLPIVTDGSMSFTNGFKVLVFEARPQSYLP